MMVSHMVHADRDVTRMSLRAETVADFPLRQKPHTAHAEAVGPLPKATHEQLQCHRAAVSVL